MGAGEGQRSLGDRAYVGHQSRVQFASCIGRETARIVLNLRLLHQAITLATYRSYARAAQALHLTQPALSRSIAGLEAQLGEKLFNRSPRGVELTAFGELVLARGRLLVDGASELEREIKLMRGLESGELRVGAGPYAAAMSVGRAIARLAAAHPQLRIDLMQGDLRATVDAVIAGRIELAVVELSLAEGEPRLVLEPLPAHRACAYCRAGHPLLDDARPTLDRILRFPFVGTRVPPRVARHFLAVAKRGTIDPDTGDYLPPLKVDNMPTAREVVLASDAVTAGPVALFADDVRAGRLARLPLPEQWGYTAYGFVARRGAVLSPAAEAFKNEVRAVEAELSPASEPWPRQEPAGEKRNGGAKPGGVRKPRAKTRARTGGASARPRRAAPHRPRGR